MTIPVAVWLDQFFAGSPGPIAVSAVNPAALASADTSTFLPGSQAYVQSLKRAFFWDPTSVATPDNSSVIAASGGGNWIALPTAGAIGSSVVGTATRGFDGTDWSTIAAGQTATIYTLQGTQLGNREVVRFSCDIDVENATVVGDIAQFSRSIVVVNNNGTITTPNGGTTDTDLTSPAPPSNAGSSLVTCAAAIVIASGTLKVQVTAPVGVSVRAAAEVFWVRRPIPGAGVVPTVTSISVASGPDLGGTSVTITGTHFTGADVVSFAGVGASFSVVDDSHITATTAPGRGSTPYTAGDVVVHLGNGNQGSLTGAWTYTPTPLGVLGQMGTAGARSDGTVGINSGWFPSSSIVGSGSTFTSWTDMSGTGNNLTTRVGTPTYNASSSSITPNGKSVSLGGTAGIGKASFVGGTATGQPRWMLIVCKPTGAGAFVYVVDFDTYVGILLNASNHPTFQDPAFGQTAWGSAAVGVVESIWGYTDYANGAKNVKISVSNGTPVTSTTGADAHVSATTGAFDVGTPGSASQECTMEAFEIITANALPSTQELAWIDQYVLATYGHH